MRPRSFIMILMLVVATGSIGYMSRRAQVIPKASLRVQINGAYFLTNRLGQVLHVSKLDCVLTNCTGRALRFAGLSMSSDNHEPSRPSSPQWFPNINRNGTVAAYQSWTFHITKEAGKRERLWLYLYREPGPVGQSIERFSSALRRVGIPLHCWPGFAEGAWYCSDWTD